MKKHAIISLLFLSLIMLLTASLIYHSYCLHMQIIQNTMNLKSESRIRENMNYDFMQAMFLTTGPIIALMGGSIVSIKLLNISLKNKITIPFLIGLDGLFTGIILIVIYTVWS